VCGNLPEKLPRDATLTVFRIVQEALRNIERHAAADEATIRLDHDGSFVRLEIRDSGRGFDRTVPGWRAGLGLASMEERVRLCDGQFHVDSVPGKGTKISVSIPIGETDEEAEDSPGR
jgi:two-component system sensor histidine kinase DegS